MTAISRPPGPKPKPLWGHLWDFRRDPLRFLEKMGAYGDVVYYTFGPQEAYLYNHPDYVKELLVNQAHNFVKSRGLQRAKRLLGEGLLTSEGEFHLRQRRLSQPAFHRQRIANYATSMVDFAVQMRDHWQDGAQLDITHEMMRLTLAIVAKTLFDANVEDSAEEIGEAMTLFVHGFKMLTLPFSEWLEKLPLPSMRKLNRAHDLLNRTIYRIINERRKSGKDRGDLLSMLLLAQDEEGDGGSMTDQQLRDEVITLFIAGHETTANLMSWTWYLLSQHPDVEAKLWQELDAVLANRLPTAEDYPRLRYAEMVVSESMRLYPPAWIIGRRAIKECEIGGYQIPVNGIAFVSPYLMQRDQRFFPDPLVFDPQRWTPEAQAARPKFSYFPFGGGARQCIGEPFAWMEAVLLLATLAQQWQLRLAPSHKVSPQPLITMRPRNGLPMILTRRFTQLSSGFAVSQYDGARGQQ
jgi:cytochrome P450